MFQRKISERPIHPIHPKSRTYDPILSHNGRRVAHRAGVRRGWLRDREQWMVLDGQDGKRYDRIETRLLNFSRNNQRFAYEARVGKKRVLVIDGEEQKRYDQVRGFSFSPDGQRVGYHARLGDKERVVVDSREQREYDRVRFLGFSEDGRSVAYGAEMGEEQLLVEVELGGADRPELPEISGPEYPDRYHFSSPEPYVVSNHGKQLEHPRFDAIVGLVRSPDGKRVAYVGKTIESSWRHEAFTVIVDGQVSKRLKYDYVDSIPIVFSPDSQHVAYVALVPKHFSEFGRGYCVVIDGNEGPIYDNIYAGPEGGYIFFDSSNELHYFVQKDRNFYRVDETLA